LRAVSFGMRSGLVLVVALAGCTTKIIVTCDLDLTLQGELGIYPSDCRGVSCINCSVLGNSPTASDFQAAQRCALDAVAARNRFVLEYDVPSADQLIRAAFTGVPTEGGQAIRVRTFAFTGDRPNPNNSMSGDNPSVSFRSCIGTPPLVDEASITGSCTPDIGQPCLACKVPSDGALLCGFQP
jgi:hypothetical protein